MMCNNDLMILQRRARWFSCVLPPTVLRFRGFRGFVANEIWMKRFDMTWHIQDSK